MTPIEMVDQAHRQLDAVASRFSFVEALQNELEKRTKGKPFIACMWEAMLAARDMAVVHFGQWVVSTNSTGLMKQLDQFRLAEFYVPKKMSKRAMARFSIENLGDPEDHRMLQESAARHQNDRLVEVYAGLFPVAAQEDRVPQRPHDVEQLRARFWAELECVKDDRNNYRAHPPYGLTGKPPKMKMLDFGEIREKLEWAHRLLKDIRLLLDRQGRGGLNSDYAAKGTAEDVADIILFGSKRMFDTMAGVSAGTWRGDGKYAWQYRDAVYDELWATHPDSPFSEEILPETKGHRAAWHLGTMGKQQEE